VIPREEIKLEVYAMKLVKDLVDNRIVYYWAGQYEKRASEFFATYLDARQWWVARVFSQYDGRERRASTIDRRSDADKLNRAFSSDVEARRQNPYGRRVTDLPVPVSIDYVPLKTKMVEASANASY
jgi:hypothetical protein